MEGKTVMQELIKWMDDNKAHCTYGTIRGKATELLAKEKQDIIDARLSAPTIILNSKTPEQEAEDYFTQKYEK